MKMKPASRTNRSSLTGRQVYLSFLFGLLFLVPSVSQAWWNDHWAYRKKITINAQTAGIGASSVPAGVPLLVRLHSGNFSYFLDLKPDAGDLRFLAADDKTPLKYHIEKFDALNNMALIWVQMPEVPASGADTGHFWMYYGNQDAASAADPKGTYDVHQVAVYHLDEKSGVAKDATAYANDATQSAAEPNPASLIGAGAKFTGAGGIVLPDSPSLRFTATGFTVTAWARITAAPQNDAYLFFRSDGTRSFVVGLDASGLYARLQDDTGAPVETPRTVAFTPGAWHHVAVTLGGGKLTLYLDGAEAASVAAPALEMGGPIVLGGSSQPDHAYIGDLDEVRLSNEVRTPVWIATVAKDEAAVSDLLTFGGDEQHGGSGAGTSYFGTILRSVTNDGWVVITLLLIMGAISLVVMGVKGRAITRTKKGNQKFIASFEALGIEVHAEAAPGARPNSTGGLPAGVMGLSDPTDEFGHSSLYRIYQAGVQELQLRLGETGAPTSEQPLLRPQSLQAIRARLDAALVRETHGLNNLMVLLTIAISGGPFLGLLGTVIGVMITFAAIAATGDVNINAIAPGIAAALVATVAGLAVAIPALFGYNYLMTRIREIGADMRVFVDEFLGRIAEAHSE